MTTYLYNVYGEGTPKDYANKKMWVSTKTEPNTIRVFPFFTLVMQTIFSIRTLKLFQPDAKIIICTNEPTYNHFKWLQKTFNNITIKNKKSVYEKYKSLSFWCYRLKYEGIMEINDDVIMMDCDTYFIKNPDFIIDDNTCWISKDYNIGVLGLSKNNIQTLIPKIIKEINEQFCPEGSENRTLEEKTVLKYLNQKNRKLIETGKWIRHYYSLTKDRDIKFSCPTEDIYEDLKKALKKSKGL